MKEATTTQMRKSRTLQVIRRFLIFLSSAVFWFSSISWLPPSINLLFLLSFGQWCWTSNLDILYRNGIDPLALLKHRKGYSVSGNYGISLFMSVAVSLAAILYKITDTEWADAGVFIAIALFWIMPAPWRLYQAERFTALDTLLNSFGHTITLAEVVLCDLLTSYSRIIMMIVLESVWMIRPTLKSKFENRRGRLDSLSDLIIPVLVAIPYILRFRQCVIEYYQSEKSTRHVPFWNACKYMSSWPVILSGYYMSEWLVAFNNPGYDTSDWSPSLVFWLWVATSLFNTLFSLYWDLVMDWHLLGRYSLIQSKRRERGILRPRLQFPPIAYYAAMCINTSLRFAWVCKCVTFGKPGLEGLDIFLIIGEMFRRWVWVCFRLEREWFVINPPLTDIDDEMGNVHEALVI